MQALNRFFLANMLGEWLVQYSDDGSPTCFSTS